MKTPICILIFILLSFNPNLVLGFGIISNFFSSLYSPISNIIPSIPTPVPILKAKLTTSVCGSQVSSCSPTRYRSMNGSCNNLEKPGWGTPDTTYLRLLPNNYFDDIFELPKSEKGKNLPNARKVSSKVFPDLLSNDLVLCLNGMQWGQIIVHEMSFLETPSAEDGDDLICTEDGKLKKVAPADEEFCAPVKIPKGDKVYEPGTYMDFVRADTDRHIGCVPEDREANQLSSITAFMDGSITYGSTDEQSASLRSFSDGNLKTVTRRGQEWPPQVENVTASCSGALSPKEPCYLGGDLRINQNTELTLLQVLSVRYHNYIADYLSHINPDWDDEKTFQEARRIFIAVYQNINYYEYLPYILGKTHMLANRLIYRRTKDNMKEYINDYDPTLVPGVISEHANAAFRYFHTLIQGYLQKKLQDRKTVGSLRLSDWFNRPSVLEENNNFDELVYGLTAQPSSVADPFFSVEITRYLFRGQNKLGDDLRTIDIQRNRDMGLGTYVEARGICNLTVPKTWNDLRGIIPENYINRLRELYRDVCDVDLTVGGSLEIHVPGALAGPTFLCIMLAQFYRTRVTDRFWYENGKDKLIAFTPDQLANIRNITMASVFCASSEAGTMQREAFEIVRIDNPVVSCDEIPSLDLDLWKYNTTPDDRDVDSGSER